MNPTTRCLTHVYSFLKYSKKFDVYYTNGVESLFNFPSHTSHYNITAFARITDFIILCDDTTKFGPTVCQKKLLHNNAIAGSKTSLIVLSKGIQFPRIGFASDSAAADDESGSRNNMTVQSGFLALCVLRPTRSNMY